jgi:hypothetical protein
MELPMPGWEYLKINLNEVPRKRNDIGLLNDAGDEGWEVVAILPNNIAYLKRELGVEASTDDDAADGKISEVKAKYRDPATGETWSGRGRMATWLKRKLDAGEDIEKYRV